VSARFRVDLLHPGWVSQTWEDWLAGPQGARRLATAVLGAVAILLLGLVAGLLPTYWRLSGDRDAVPQLRRELEVREADLSLLRSNLQALSQEARRQVSWADLLATLSRQTPSMLKLRLVEAGRVPPPAVPGQAPGPAKAEEVLRIEAFTALRPGGPPLLDVAQFITALTRDPAVSRRYVLRSWEIKPSGIASPSGEQLLTITIALTERSE